MIPLRTRLQEARRRLALPWEALERDYLLSWGLTAISQMPTLCDMLVFKGGTALRKCYFGDYRFSEDLDFSALAAVPTGDEMEQSIRQACEAAVRLLDEYAPVEIACERYTEREPHPGGKEAFTIRARFPWQSRPQTRVMIEVTVDERVLRPPEKRRVIHEYGEPPSAEILVYPLEEIVAEKLRALLQQAAMFEARGWKPLARPRLLRPLARARCFVRSAPSGASPSQARTNSSTTVCLPSSRRPGNSGSAPSCWTCLHSRRGCVKGCVNVIRRRPPLALPQRRFHRHIGGRDRPPPSTQGPSDA